MKNKFLILLCLCTVLLFLYSCNTQSVQRGNKNDEVIASDISDNNEKVKQEEAREKEPEKEEGKVKYTNIRTGFMYKVGSNYGFLNKYGEVVIEPVFQNVQQDFSDNGLLYVCANGLFGFLNENAEMVIERNFMGTKGFGENGTALVMTGMFEFGYINEKGEMVIAPTTYEGSIVELYNFDKFGFARVLIDNKFGLIDENGNWVVYPEYNHIGSFADNGLASVGIWNTDYRGMPKNQKFGFINTRGEIVIPIQYYAQDDFENVYGDFYIAPVQDEYSSDYYYINSNGETVTDEIAIAAYSSYKAHDNLKIIYEHKNYYDHARYALINSTDGSVLFDLEYEEISFFEDGMIYFKKDGVCGLANSKGEIIFELDCTNILDKDALGYYWAQKQNGSWICLNKNGEQVFSKTFDDTAGFAENGLARVGVEVNYRVKYGYIDKSGEFVIEPKFNGYSANFSKYGYATVCLEVDYQNKYGVIDESGNWVIEPTYDYISQGYHTNVFAVIVDGNWGAINKDGVEIIMPQYDKIEFELDGSLIVCEYDDTYDVYYKDGRLIGTGYSEVGGISYRLTGYDSDEYIKIEKNSKIGLIDKNGDILVEPICDNIWLMQDAREK